MKEVFGIVLLGLIGLGNVTLAGTAKKCAGYYTDAIHLEKNKVKAAELFDLYPNDAKVAYFQFPNGTKFYLAPSKNGHYLKWGTYGEVNGKMVHVEIDSLRDDEVLNDKNLVKEFNDVVLPVLKLDGSRVVTAGNGGSILILSDRRVIESKVSDSTVNAFVPEFTLGAEPLPSIVGSNPKPRKILAYEVVKVVTALGDRTEVVKAQFEGLSFLSILQPEPFGFIKARSSEERAPLSNNAIVLEKF